MDQVAGRGLSVVSWYACVHDFSALSATRSRSHRTVAYPTFVLQTCVFQAEDFGFHHLSTGDLLREEIKKGTEIGKKCEKLIKDGKLVSLAVILQLLQRAIIVAQRKSFLIDGIKTAEQAKEFDTKVRSLQSPPTPCLL